MFSQTITSTRSQFQSSKDKSRGKTRVLLVSDAPDHLDNLQAELETGEVEITNAKSVEEVRSACRRQHDVAVVDVSPSQLVKVLTTLRASEGYADISVLVDASRLTSEPSLAGVLPAYRAMPCSHSQLVALARRCASKVRRIVRPRKRLL
jgi:DNA-binding NtrC family response regulator